MRLRVVVQPGSMSREHNQLLPLSAKSRTQSVGAGSPRFDQIIQLIGMPPQTTRHLLSSGEPVGKCSADPLSSVLCFPPSCHVNETGEPATEPKYNCKVRCKWVQPGAAHAKNQIMSSLTARWTRYVSFQPTHAPILTPVTKQPFGQYSAYESEVLRKENLR